MLSPGRDRRTISPSITLATFKPTDNLSTLVARVGAYPKISVAHRRVAAVSPSNG
jgi:hypothetical protein